MNKTIIAAVAALAISGTAVAATPAPAETKKVSAPATIKQAAPSAPATVQVPVSLVKATIEYISRQPINTAMPIFQQWAAYVQSQQNASK